MGKFLFNLKRPRKGVCRRLFTALLLALLALSFLATSAGAG